MWRESAKREVSIRSLALADEPQYFRIIDDEGGLPIGHLWAEEDVEEPFRGPDRPALVTERLLAPDQEQRIARDRVDGLHPSAFEDGKAAEGIHVESAHLGGLEQRRTHRRERERTCHPREDFRGGHAGSDATRRRTNDRRNESAKWKMSPAATRTQEA